MIKGPCLPGLSKLMVEQGVRTPPGPPGPRFSLFRLTSDLFKCLSSAGESFDPWEFPEGMALSKSAVFRCTLISFEAVSDEFEPGTSMLLTRLRSSTSIGTGLDNSDVSLELEFGGGAQGGQGPPCSTISLGSPGGQDPLINHWFGGPGEAGLSGGLLPPPPWAPPPD